MPIRSPALALVPFLAAGSLTCSPLYVIRAGIEEGKILSRRRPIDEVVADPSTSPAVRAKLRLVLETRTFAREFLELDVGESYTTYSWVERDTLAHVLSAARKDRFEAFTWWFPIVGHVPYKGFFSLESAHKAAAALEQRGYDTYVRPTSAFSTLGWFNDPVLSTTLQSADVPLVATVIHELTHNTIFVASQVAFNESFANFVGDRGAIEFFCRLEGDDGTRCRQARALWADNLVYGDFLQDLVRRLEELYADDLALDSLLALREQVFHDAKARFEERVAPRLATNAFTGFASRPLNNATLISRRLYYDRLRLFEAVFQRLDGDLRASINRIAAAAKGSSDPYATLENIAGP